MGLFDHAKTSPWRFYTSIAAILIIFGIYLFKDRLELTSDQIFYFKIGAFALIILSYADRFLKKKNVEQNKDSNLLDD